MEKECCTPDVHSPSEKHSHTHTHTHEHKAEENGFLKLFLPAIISGVLLATGLIIDHYIKPEWFSGWIRLAFYLLAYLPVGLGVIKEAFESIKQGDVFSEFFLMSIATIGAFAIDQFPEGVAVMLFYSVGEAFQGMAVSKAKNNIKNLLDQRPDEVTVLENSIPKTIKAEEAVIGQVIRLKPGEKLALDGELFSQSASFNTSALTGESKPDTKRKGDEVLAGMINLNSVSEIIIKKEFQDSKLSKILELVQNASSQKAKTELFIRKFANIYTPIVVFLALAICFLPYFFVQDYQLRDWLYRALIFLVISCPCALVISIPLGYFGGIGAAGRNGILFKGSNFIDILANVQNVVMDKTGTLTEGVFKVKEVQIAPEFNQKEILSLLNTIENNSSHPIATAVHEFVGKPEDSIRFDSIEEIPGYGLKGMIGGKVFLAGNFKLLDQFGVSYKIDPSQFTETLIATAYDGQFSGYLSIADHIKPDAQSAIEKLHQLGIKTTMLSGDKSSVVAQVAKTLSIDNAFGDLLPEDKVAKVNLLKSQKQSVAFVGDGINDAPVVALSDVGLAMGGLGSDATIETADVVIQDDKPSKIPMAIKIGKETRKIVWQNIALAFGVKLFVLILGAGGLATMWEAVFADVGVALLAILNAVRIQRMNFS